MQKSESEKQKQESLVIKEAVIAGKKKQPWQYVIMSCLESFWTSGHCLVIN
jgi:delta-aminolevulinic acid dehydratase/porphobilinogen synthase